MNTFENMRNAALAVVAATSIAQAQSAKPNTKLIAPELLNVTQGVAIVSTSSQFLPGQNRMSSITVGYKSDADTAKTYFVTGTDKNLDNVLSASEVTKVEEVKKIVKTTGGRGNVPLSTKMTTQTRTIDLRSESTKITQFIPAGPKMDPVRHTQMLDKKTGQPLFVEATTKIVKQDPAVPREGSVFLDAAVNALFNVTPQ